MSPHPASAATCVLTRATVPAEPAALASTAPASQCLSVKESGAVRRFFHGVSIVNDVCFCLSLIVIVIVCLCVELWWQFGMRNVVKGQGNTTAGPVLARVGAGAGGTAADLTEDGRMMAMGARPGGGVCLLLLTATALVRKLHPIPPRPFIPVDLYSHFSAVVDECSELHSSTASAGSSYLVHVLRTILVPIICPPSSDQEAARWNAGTDGAGRAGRWRRRRGDGMQDSLAG